MEQDAASRALDCLLASLVVHLSGRVPSQPHHGEHAAADSHAAALVLCAGNIAHPRRYSAFADCAASDPVACACTPASCRFRFCPHCRDCNPVGSIHPAGQGLSDGTTGLAFSLPT